MIEIRRTDTVDLLHTGKGELISVPFTAWFTEDPRFPGKAVAIEIHQTPDRSHLHVVAVTVSDETGGIQSSSLRIPLTELRDEAIREEILEVDPDTTSVADGHLCIRPMSPDDPRLDAVIRFLTRPPRKARADVSSEQLREVADAYRTALAEGNPKVRQAVMDRLSLTQATAATWIGLARNHVDPATGQPFLGPATGPRAGEGELTAS